MRCVINVTAARPTVVCGIISPARVLDRLSPACQCVFLDRRHNDKRQKIGDMMQADAQTGRYNHTNALYPSKHA